MNVADIQTFVRAMCARDLDHFDLSRLVDCALAVDPQVDVVPELRAMVRELLLTIGPLLYQSGYYAGAAAGMEVTQEVHRV